MTIPFYNSDDPDSIRQVFSNDGERLAKAGFSFPGELKATADDTVPKTIGQEVVSFAMPQATIDAYEAWLTTGSEESF